ncbi:MAG: phosphoglucosamine mutase [Anaerolineae bacterium]
MTVVEFGTDGIRGKAGVWPISAEGALQIGLGLGAYLRGRSAAPAVVIGRDTRLSGAALAAGLAAGLLSRGVQVIDVGVITTAGVAFLARHHQLDAGVVISASHNPWQENGIKVIGGDGFKPPEEMERGIEAKIAEVIAGGPGEEAVFGVLEHRPDWVDEYIAFLVKPFKPGMLAGMKVAVDCGNGAASAIAGRCFDLLGCTTTILNAAPDGVNINDGGGSEHVRNGSAALYEVVTKGGLDFGVAFDGDADRAVFVDETGQMRDGDHILYILGRYLRSRGLLAGDMVVTTVMANSGLDLALQQEGMRTLRTKVGDKYIVREMQAHGYVVGGEQSGHILIFTDADHTTGDGIFTALYVASILAEDRGQTLSQLAAPVIKLPQVVASAHVRTKPDLGSIAELEQARAEALAELGEGITINTRYSGTEPVFRAMIEGQAGHTLAQVARHALRLCRAVQAAGGYPDGPVEVKNTTTGSLIDLSEIA